MTIKFLTQPNYFELTLLFIMSYGNRDRETSCFSMEWVKQAFFIAWVKVKQPALPCDG